MIRFKTGDLFAEEAEALVNTVNCVGVMGRGIALQFKRAFPSNFKAYAAQCKRGEMKPGRVFVFETGSGVPPRYIINFPSKRHWRGKSRLEDIESGLRSLVRELRARDIRSVAIPPLGSGLGGLDWSLVRTCILRAFEDLDDIEVVVFEPGGGPVDKRANRSSDVPRMTPGRAALVGLLDRYLRGLLDPFVTLEEAHKLMYFMQAAGEPLKLRFKKGHYGPYAENLRHVLHAIEGHMISGYADGGDRPRKRLRLVPGALDDAQAFVVTTPDTQTRFNRVGELVAGFESPFGLELLSTVHWVVTQEGSACFDDVVDKTYDWNARKKAFSQRQIELACEVLREKGWLTDGVASRDKTQPVADDE
ncbi:type II toxin-antitoxin system antitoxin DNA ADP-ribosyl glycohydrolase DarG [Candidatus Palauibacter sp.]|uniref:type II toxin-antitoxin system antitoxin DNA ADP-ribosyl glycohydrolase DarG n=1 Tax=Candidatus Palauibacter sp. TaxID=3101350 RepID=UPI003B527DEF